MVSLSSISKNMSGTPLFTNASFQIFPGEKIGLVGPNGAGKTTLFRIIMGEVQPDAGSVSVQNNVRIAYFSQSVGDMKDAPRSGK